MNEINNEINSDTNVVINQNDSNNQNQQIILNSIENTINSAEDCPNISSEIESIIDINNKAIDYIKNEKPDIALSKLKQVELKFERIVLEFGQNIDKKLLMVVLHNIACCYQKMKDYENCISYLEAVIYHFEGMLENKYKINLKHGFLNLDPIFNKDQVTITSLKDAKNDEIQKEELSQFEDIILQLRYFAKFHLQMCAVLSQANKHRQALKHSEIATLLCEDNLIKTKLLFGKIISKKQEKLLELDKIINSNSEGDVANSNEILEKTLESKNEILKEITVAKEIEVVNISIIQRIKIFREKICYGTCVTEAGVNDKILNYFINPSYPVYSHYFNNEIIDENSDDFKNKLKALENTEDPENDWIKLLNIGNIMYLSPLALEELDLESESGCELLRDAFIEKIVMLSVSYFCLATEYKFLSDTTNTNYLTENNKNEVDKMQTTNNINNSNKIKPINTKLIISELFHSKAVEFSYGYIPLSCPIVKHYINTYNKHYNSNFEPIVSNIL